MLVTDAQRRAVRKYDASIWKKSIRLTREQEKKVRRAAELSGKSLNQFMVDAIMKASNEMCE